MKRSAIFILTLLLFAYKGHGQDDIFGKWKTIDDETGEAKSIVEIYPVDDEVHGRMTQRSLKRLLDKIQKED